MDTFASDRCVSDVPMLANEFSGFNAALSVGYPGTFEQLFAAF